MARVSKGNPLTSLILQPGWTIEEDGFGLLTSRLVFVTGHGSDTDASPLILEDAPKRGDAHPKDTRLTCHRTTVTCNANGLAVITSEYIGIASGNMTAVEVSGRANMSQEPIATHPDFVSRIGGQDGAPLNGAQFSNGAFVRFAYDPDASPNKEGVRSYLNPGFGVSGHFYTSDITAAQKLKDSLGKTSGSGIFAGIQLLGGLGSINGQTSDSWYGNWTVKNKEYDQLLLSGLAIDFFGTLVKVSYDITYQRYGWDPDIYDRDVSGVGA